MNQFMLSQVKKVSRGEIDEKMKKMFVGSCSFPVGVATHQRAKRVTLVDPDEQVFGIRNLCFRMFKRNAVDLL